MKILTFVDSAVLIYAATRSKPETVSRRFRALNILSDPDRTFAASDFLKLEVLPIPAFYKRRRELKFYEAYFSAVSAWIEAPRLIDPALQIACAYGLNAIDALHVAAARELGAELITAERPSKPIYQSYSKVTSIY